MQGVAQAVRRRGPGRRHQGLGQNLAAKDPQRAVVRIEATEDVLLDLFEVEETNQFRDGASHPLFRAWPHRFAEIAR